MPLLSLINRKFQFLYKPKRDSLKNKVKAKFLKQKLKKTLHFWNGGIGIIKKKHDQAAFSACITLTTQMHIIS